MSEDHDILRALDRSGSPSSEPFRSELADRISAAWNDEIFLSEAAPRRRRARRILPIGLAASIGVGGVLVYSVTRPAGEDIVNSVEVVAPTTIPTTAPTTAPAAGPEIQPDAPPTSELPSGVVVDPSIPTLPRFQQLSIEQFGDDVMLGVSPDGQLWVADPTGPATGPIVVRWKPELVVDQSAYSEYRDVSTTLTVRPIAVTASSTVDVDLGVGISIRLQLDPSLGPWTAAAHTVAESNVTMLTVTPASGAAPAVYAIAAGGPNGAEAGILATTGAAVGASGRFAFVRTGDIVEAFDIGGLTSQSSAPPTTQTADPQLPVPIDDPAIIVSLTNPPVPLLIDQPFATVTGIDPQIGPLLSIDPTGSAILNPISGVLQRFDLTDAPYDEVNLAGAVDDRPIRVLIHEEVAYVGSVNGIVRAYALSGPRRGDQLAASPPTEYPATTFVLGYSGIHIDYFDFDTPPTLGYVDREGGPGATIDLPPVDFGRGSASRSLGDGTNEAGRLDAIGLIMNGREFTIATASSGAGTSTAASVHRGKDSGLVELDANGDRFLFIDRAGESRSSEWRRPGDWRVGDSNAAGTLLWLSQPDGSALVARLPGSTLVGVLSDGTVVDETTDRTGGSRLAFWTSTGVLAGTFHLDLPLNWVAWDTALLLGPDLSTRHIDLRADHRGEMIGDLDPGQQTDRTLRFPPLGGPEDSGDAFGVLIPNDVTPPPIVTASYHAGSGITIERADTGGRWTLSYAGSTISARDFLARSDGSLVALLDVAEPAGRRWTQVVVLPGDSGEIDWFRSFMTKPGCSPRFALTDTTVFALACGTLEAVPLPI